MGNLNFKIEISLDTELVFTVIFRRCNSSLSAIWPGNIIIAALLYPIISMLIHVVLNLFRIQVSIISSAAQQDKLPYVWVNYSPGA
jgi:hypothetical protein